MMVSYTTHAPKIDSNSLHFQSTSPNFFVLLADKFVTIYTCMSHQYYSYNDGGNIIVSLGLASFPGSPH